VIWENNHNHNDGDHPGAGRSVGCPRALAKGVFPKVTDAPVPPEMRQHPRRTNSLAANGSSARPPPCLLRQSERKVNFVDNLVGKWERPTFHRSHLLNILSPV
jgi:hypothetical protein